MNEERKTKNENFFLCGLPEVHPPAGGLHASGVLVNLRSAGKPLWPLRLEWQLKGVKVPGISGTAAFQKS